MSEKDELEQIIEEELQKDEAEVVVPKKKGITGSTLKIIAIITMFIDHFSACLLTGFLNSKGMELIITPEQGYEFLANYGVIYYTAQIMRLIGRIAFPIFIFCLVEGFHHTRNKLKYMRNLAIFALLSEIPFDLAFSGNMIYLGYQNVMVTMLLGVATMYLMDKVKALKFQDKLSSLSIVGYFVSGVMLSGIFVFQYFSGNVLYTFTEYWPELLVSGAAAVGIFLLCQLHRPAEAKNRLAAMLLAMLPAMIIAIVANCDYNALGIMAIGIMYLLYEKNMVLEFSIGCLALVIFQPVEMFAFLGLPFISKYNGQRGINMKYFFYAFYPVHILLIYLATYIFGWIGFSVM